VSLAVVASASAATVTSFTPTSGLALTPADGSFCPGGTIAVTGTGFVSDGPATSLSVSFNGKQSPSVQIGSNTTVFAVVPTDATTGPISVTTAAGTATSPTAFTVNPCPYTSDALAQVSVPVIKSMKPGSGKVGTKVVITGTSLVGTFKVTFGGVKAKFTRDSPNQITAVVPAKAKTGKIAVFNPAGSSTTLNAFKVKK
jgi:IPT/TIG domain